MSDLRVAPVFATWPHSTFNRNISSLTHIHSSTKPTHREPREVPDYFSPRARCHHMQTTLATQRELRTSNANMIACDANSTLV